MNEFHAIKKENRVLNCSSNIINCNVKNNSTTFSRKGESGGLRHLDVTFPVTTNDVNRRGNAQL